MWAIFLTFLVIAGGITDATPDCSLRLHRACPPNNLPHEFPETEDDLSTFCKHTIELLQCGITFEQQCHTEEDFFPTAYHILDTLHEVCNKDTLLHEAVVENLKCFRELVEEEVGCNFRPEFGERLQDHIQELMQGGIEADTDIGNVTYSCLRTLHFFACNGLRTEKKCGKIALNAYIEIIRRISIVSLEGCDERINDFLPSFVEYYKLAEEEQNENDLEQGA